MQHNKWETIAWGRCQDEKDCTEKEIETQLDEYVARE